VPNHLGGTSPFDSGAETLDGDVGVTDIALKALKAWIASGSIQVLRSAKREVIDSASSLHEKVTRVDATLWLTLRQEW